MRSIETDKMIVARTLSGGLPPRPRFAVGQKARLYNGESIVTITALTPLTAMVKHGGTYAGKPRRALLRHLWVSWEDELAWVAGYLAAQQRHFKPGLLERAIKSN